MPRRTQHSTDILLVLILFFVYAGSALLLSVLGISSYSRTVAVLQEGFNERSGILYIAQKVQQNDLAGGVKLSTYQGNDALILIEQETGQGFETWIFIQDGYLCELMISSGDQIIPQAAQRIMPMQELKLTLSREQLLTVSVTTETNSVNTISLALRSSGEAFNAGNNPPPSPSVAQPREPVIMNPPASEGGTN